MTDALVWGTKAKDGAPPVRLENAVPAIVTRQELRKARKMLESRARPSPPRQAFASACPRIVGLCLPVQRCLFRAAGRPLLEAHHEIAVDLRYRLIPDET